MKQLTVSCLAWLLKGVCLILSTNSQGCLSSALVVNDSKCVRLKYDREEQSASSFSWKEPDNISVLDMLQPVTFSQRAAFSILSLFQAMPINFTFSNVLSYRNKRPRNQLLLWHKKVIPILCAESVQILDQLFRLSVALIFHRICFQHFEKSEEVEHEIAQRRKYIKTSLFQFLFAASH